MFCPLSPSLCWSGWLSLFCIGWCVDIEQSSRSDDFGHAHQRAEPSLSRGGGLESWKRITARHQRRARQPRYCRNPTNRRWCDRPNCQEIAAGRVISDRARYYCKAHDRGRIQPRSWLPEFSPIHCESFPSGAAATRAVAIRSLRVRSRWPRVRYWCPRCRTGRNHHRGRPQRRNVAAERIG